MWTTASHTPFALIDFRLSPTHLSETSLRGIRQLLEAELRKKGQMTVQILVHVPVDLFVNALMCVYLFYVLFVVRDMGGRPL